MITGVGMGASLAPARTAKRPPAEDRGDEFVRALEAASRGIRDPVAKLKYIRGSLGRYSSVHRVIGRLPGPLRRSLYRWLSLEGLRHLMTSNPNGAPIRVDAGMQRSLRIARATLAAGALGVAAMGVGAATYRPAQSAPPAPPLRGATAPLREPVAEVLPPLPSGVKPAQVWVVEKGQGFEQYSNGLRIDTTFATAGDPRRFHTFAYPGGMQDASYQKPVGILFHTSESDIWPLEAANNEKLRDSSRRLLLYCQRLRLYNFLVDRFGRVFRLVEEESKANHAGNSVWEREGVLYLSLNNAFLGVCFETRWEGGRALPITAAQLSAGRNLTDYLRQRWEIPGEMCSTHGLTSVNPSKRLIGHHVDWARGFPFEAFGLPDQYGRTAAAVAVFGFGYDGDFLKVLGEPWAGVRDAERALAEEASRQGKTLDELRRERHGLYDRWHSEQSRDEEAWASTRADRAPKRGPLGG